MKKKEKERYVITSTIPETFEINAYDEDDAMERFLKYVAFSVTEIKSKEIKEDE